MLKEVKAYPEIIPPKSDLGSTKYSDGEESCAYEDRVQNQEADAYCI